MPSIAPSPTRPTRPLARWHGGKWKLARWIISHMPAHRTYTEAFSGAASVLMQKPRSYAEVINDMDGELVNLFRVARDRGEELRSKLELTPFSRVEFVGSYTPDEDPLEQARRTIARSFMGFGSNAHNKATGFRANSNRSGTTPAHGWRNYPAALIAIIERLQGVCIEQRAAIDVIAQHDSPQTLHYVDPPYVLSTRADAAHDYRHEMTDDQHRALAKVLGGVDGKVIVSGYHSPLYDEIFEGWSRVERPAHADGAKDRTEVLWMNFEPEGQLL